MVSSNSMLFRLSCGLEMWVMMSLAPLALASGPKTFRLVVDVATLSPFPPSFRSPLADESWVGTGDPDRHLAIQSRFHLGELGGELKSTPFETSSSGAIENIFSTMLPHDYCSLGLYTSRA